MATFAGNVLCKLSVGIQCRVLLLPWMKRSGSIRHLNCRASSSFPVRYRPKKTLKAEEPQTPSIPMKGAEDEVMNNDLSQKAQRFGVSKSFPVKYHPKKTMKTEGPQISSIPMKVPVAEVMNKDLNKKELIFEVANSFPDRYQPNKTLKTEEPTPTKGLDEEIKKDLNQKALICEAFHPMKTSNTEGTLTSCIPMKGPEDEVMNKDLNQKALRLEVSTSLSVRHHPKKTSKAEEPWTFTPTKGHKDGVMNNNLDQKALRFEISNGKKYLHRSFVLDQKLQSQIEGPIPYLACNNNQEVEEDIDYDQGLLEYECIEESESEVMSSGSTQKALRFKVSKGRKNIQRIIKKSQNQIQIPIQYYDINGDKSILPNVEEEIGCNEGALGYEWTEEPKEVVEELRILQGEIPWKDNALLGGKTKQDVEKLAIELLAARAFTAVELRKKLQAKRFPIDVINAVIIDFQSRGLINDCLYAETFSRSRWSSSSWGPRRIKQALFKKGVSEDDAQKAIKLVFQESGYSDDHEPRFGLSKTSMDHLFVQASKQWHRGRDITDETRKARIIRWLQYRGFNWGVISFILKKLESECIP